MLVSIHPIAKSDGMNADTKLNQLLKDKKGKKSDL